MAKVTRKQRQAGPVLKAYILNIRISIESHLKLAEILQNIPTQEVMVTLVTLVIDDGQVKSEK